MAFSMDDAMREVSATGLDHKLLPSLTIGIAGLGLMGGSLALGLAGKCARRIGWDVNPQAQQTALARGAIDESAGSLRELVDRAEAIVLAAPVRAILEMLRDLENMAPPAGAMRILTDVGSTKQDIVLRMQHLGEGWDPIGAHPFCGREVSGIAHADGALFQRAVFFLCPLPATSARARGFAQEMVAALGAASLEMDVEMHDRLVAATSHLPYLAAVALALTASHIPSAARAVGSGFRDTARLAGSSLEMMTDILATNRRPVLDALDAYMDQLKEIRDRLQAGDEIRLRALLEEGRHAREKILTDSPHLRSRTPPPASKGKGEKDES
jgi:prephenate dehydrogenase